MVVEGPSLLTGSQFLLTLRSIQSIDILLQTGWVVASESPHEGFTVPFLRSLVVDEERIRPAGEFFGDCL